MAVAKRFTMPDSVAGGYYTAANASAPEHASVAANASALDHAGPVSSNAPFWYSFEYGSAHFTIISTEHDLSRHSDQRQVVAACLLIHAACLWPVSHILLLRHADHSPLQCVLSLLPSVF